MKRLTEPFLEKPGILPKVKKTITKKPTIQEALQEPLLILMRNDGYSDIIEGVNPGRFTLSDGDINKDIMLTQEKLTTIRYGENYYKCWVAHEDCATPFPQDPIYLAEQLHKIVQKMRMNWRDRDEANVWKAKGNFWMKVLVGVGILITLLVTTGAIDAITGFLAGGGGQAAAKTAVTAIQTNITNGTINPGVIIT